MGVHIMTDSGKIASMVMLGKWRVHVGSGKASARQVHGNGIIPVYELVPGKTEADGIFINKPDIKASVGFADCMPLALMGQGRGVILHVSRKTLVAGLLDAVPKWINPKAIQYVWIGPHICEQHFTFEWEGEGIAEFKHRFPTATQQAGGITHLSLREAVQIYFDDWGVDPSAVTKDGRCTYETSVLSSWRRHLESGKSQQTLQVFTATLWKT